MAADILTEFNDVVKVTKDLSEHCLYVWNFYWIVNAAVLGYLLTDKGDVLASSHIRRALIVGYILFAAGNGTVLHRAADKHDMGHQLLLKVYHERYADAQKNEGAGIPAAASGAVQQTPDLKQFNTTNLGMILGMLRETQPTSAWGIRVMHSVLSLGMCVLIWFAPAWKGRKIEAAPSSGASPVS